MAKAGTLTVAETRAAAGRPRLRLTGLKERVSGLFALSDDPVLTPKLPILLAYHGVPRAKSGRWLLPRGFKSRRVEGTNVWVANAKHRSLTQEHFRNYLKEYIFFRAAILSARRIYNRPRPRKKNTKQKKKNQAAARRARRARRRPHRSHDGRRSVSPCLEAGGPRPLLARAGNTTWLHTSTTALRLGAFPVFEGEHAEALPGGRDEPGEQFDNEGRTRGSNETRLGDDGFRAACRDLRQSGPHFGSAGLSRGAAVASGRGGN